MAPAGPIACTFSKTDRKDRPILWISLQDLAPAGLASATQYNRIGKLLLRFWAWGAPQATHVTQDCYTLRWFRKDHIARYGLADGIGLRVWHQGKLTPWKDLESP